MRIGIDARPLGRQRTGIENYVRGLVELLPQVAPQHKYFLYSNRPIELSCSAGSLSKRIDGAYRWCAGSFWLLGRGAHLARQDKLDVFWSTVEVLPPGIPQGVLKIVTVYDLFGLRFPQTTTPYSLLVQKLCFRRAIASADRLMVISRFTAEELSRLLGVPEEKALVVYPGIVDRYKPQDQVKAAQYISRKYGTPPRYLATVGTIQPRKNQQFLVGVLRILKDLGQLECPLLIAGAIGWKNSPLFRKIREVGLTESDIRFLGYVPDEDMPSFYAGAQVFLFPTLYEGFGIPPVEAMACGTPVISSDAPAMPEVLGDAAILEPLSSPERFAAAIHRVLTDAQTRESLSVKGIQRAQAFRYETSVMQLLDVFEKPPRPVSTEPDRKDAMAAVDATS